MVFWFFAAKWRRRWLVLVPLVGAAVGLVLVNIGHWYLSEWSGGTIHLPVLRAVMYPYTAFVVVVAVYIAALPRRDERRLPGSCGGCGYSLDGLELDDPELCCPECGVAYVAPVSAWGGTDPAIRRRQLARWGGPIATAPRDATGRPIAE